MDICEKIAYIKGLAEGLALDETTKEGKILAAIIDLLGDITEEICDIEDGCDALMEQIDAVDEDLASLEEVIYEDDDDCDCCDCDCDDEDGDCCDCGCDCGCDCDDDEEEFYCAMCPSCGGKVYFDDTVSAEDVVCPNCQKPLLEEEDEGEDL